MALFSRMCGCIEAEGEPDVGPLYMGIDLSTQGVKAVVLDGALVQRYQASVNFDFDLPQFRTTGGVHHHPDGVTVTSPPLMWCAGLDLLFERLGSARCPFDSTVSVSVSAQQHGMVLLAPGSRDQFHQLSPMKSVASQVSPCFTLPDTPVWMDSSTAAQCEAFEEAMGGAQVVADVTGSKAYERFTGQQIAKLYRTQPAVYNGTDRICLVSNFVTSVLCGSYTPLDLADASGMNLLDLVDRGWWDAAIHHAAPALAAKLGPLVSSHTVVGCVSPYFTRRYGFGPDCTVVAGTGDNPSTLAGLGMGEGDVCVSLGTSDTLFACVEAPTPLASEGHVFVNPILPDQFMAIIVYKNGSLARENVKKSVCDGGDWVKFSNLLDKTPVGNNGNIGFYFELPEITPTVPAGVHRFNTNGHRVESFPPEVEARAVLEGQFLSMREHGSNIGIVPRQILATGGASANRAILQIISDVFGVPVIQCAEQGGNGAAIGAAYRALHGLVCHRDKAWAPFNDVIAAARGAHDPTRLARVEPNFRHHRIYNDLLEKYRVLETRIRTEAK